MEGLDVTPEFWRGKRVFLTGHTGFKGSWLSLWLQSMGAELTGYALQPPTTPSLFEQARVGDGMTSITADIADLEQLVRVMRQARPEIVIHMAAQSLVRYSYDHPVETYLTNVMGTVHLLDAVRQTAGVKAVVNVTSDKCYDNREWVWGYREVDAMGGYDPYSNSKGCSELVSSSYRQSFFNPRDYAVHGVALATARAGNVIGGGDWARDRLVPDIVAAFGKGQPVHIRNPHAIRPWQHVLEPLSGYLELAERVFNDGPACAEAWNFGPSDDDARPVAWIVEQMAGLWGEGAGWRVDDGVHPHEAGYLKLDVSKARSRLNWHPMLPLGEALKLVVDWAKRREAGADARELTLEQIMSYQMVRSS
ncbi:CDP-glucose 4,6-dehydratase [Rhodopseudomonas sp. BR0C11]|uniref:CDP-glucose 4,6-dehydratase n=1 Tax=Rhodopseudomonas sp. BR0C11 TaxID=2269370 RepID=UPI001966D9C2|nr:CDP-glucose 4,6-dehydratase [Rhodopseudomonas sp. BR0C11]